MVIFFVVVCLLSPICFTHAKTLNTTINLFDNTENNLEKATKDKEDLYKNTESLFQDCKTKQINKFKTSSKSKSACKDPLPSVMLANFVTFQYSLKAISGILDISNIQDAFKKYINNEIPHTHDPLTFGSLKCEGNKMNATNLNELSVCPWHTTVEVRENRYPMMVTHAKCNCEKCLHLNLYETNFDEKFKCTPLYRLAPALLREDDCNSQTGVYEWKPILEKIPVLCVCSRSKKIIG